MKTQVNLAGILMKNPVMSASGTFGYGIRASKFFNLDDLGALVTKTITLKEKIGNPPHRMCDLLDSPGVLNSVGMENKGVSWFVEEVIPFLGQYSVPLIVSIAGDSIEDFAEVARRLSSPRVNGLEMNISCPNVKEGGMAFGTDPKATYDVVQAVRESTTKPIIVKLSPNVTSIVEIAEAAYEAGANALSMINTVLGMCINVETREPMIHGNKTYMGGLSGPCIRPIGIRCVYQVYKSRIDLPIIGIGGIMNGRDVIEYILAGATAVGVGSANLVDPAEAMPNIIKGIEEYMKKHQIEDINDLRGNIQEFQ